MGCAGWTSFSKTINKTNNDGPRLPNLGGRFSLKVCSSLPETPVCSPVWVGL
jgi:hypothetical protein